MFQLEEKNVNFLDGCTDRDQAQGPQKDPQQNAAGQQRPYSAGDQTGGGERTAQSQHRYMNRRQRENSTESVQVYEQEAEREQHRASTGI